MVPDGLGTALKPAYEPIILARRPLSGTVAANVLAHGTGAINIDASRVGTNGGTKAVDFNGPRGNGVYGNGQGSHKNAIEDIAAGRWPPNVLLDEAAAALLDQMSGERKTGKLSRKRPAVGWNGQKDWRDCDYGGDTGGASRFFPVLPTDDPDVERFLYAPKASRRERDAGCEELAETRSEYRPNDPDINSLQTRLHGSIRSRNSHPTVKPIAVMRWLVRLVTPPGGTVLDLFTGSGTTGCAAVLEGFAFKGSEREPEHMEIARRRIAYWREHEHVMPGNGKRPAMNRDGEASADRRYAANGSTPFAMTPGPRYDVAPKRRDGLVQSSFIAEGD